MFSDATRAEVFAGLLRSLEDAPDNIDIATMSDLKALYDNMKGPMLYPSMSTQSKQGRKEAWTPTSFTRLIVDKIAALTYGRMVERLTGLDEKTEAMFASVYKPARGAFIRLAKMSSLAGFAVIRIHRAWTGSYFFRLYGFDEVEPILDPANPSGLPFGIKYSLLLSELPRWVHEYNPGLRKERIYVYEEVITRHERDENGQIVNPGLYEVMVEGKRMRTPYNGINPLGDYLGAVWWRGIEHPFNPWGGSDVLPIYQTLVRLNELLTDGTELLQWGLHSPVVTNMKGKLDWKYSPRSIWQADKAGVDENIFVKRLESGLAGLTDLQAFIEMLVQAVHRDSRIPAVAVGALSGLGEASSGRAFEIAMTPAKELVAEKENVCIPQELELMEELAARMIYYKDMTGKTYYYESFDMPDPIALRTLLKDASVSFAPLTFPQEIIPETITGQVTGGLRSREDAIQHLHPTWNETQIQEEIKKIDAETQQTGDTSAEANIAAMRARLAGQGQ